MPKITNTIALILLISFPFQNVMAEKDKEKETHSSSSHKTTPIKHASASEEVDSDTEKQDEITIRVICETVAPSSTVQADDIEKSLVEEDAENAFEKNYFACLRRPAFLITRSSKFVQYFSWFSATTLTGCAVLNTVDETTANGLTTAALVFNIMGIAAAGVQAYAEKFLEEAEEKR